MFSIGVGDERPTDIFHDLSIVYSLSSRKSQTPHPHCFVSSTKSKAKKIEMSKTPGENYSASEVARVAKHTHLNRTYLMTFSPGLLLSHLQTCLNSFQNSIPFLSPRNKTNESVDMPHAFQSSKLILN